MFGSQMRRICKVLVLTCVCGVVWHGQFASHASANALPSFQEVYELLRTNMPGTSLPELEHASVEGLLKRLGPRVELVYDRTNSGSFTPACALAATNLFDDSIVYFRISDVTSSLPSDLLSALEATKGTNKLSGMVLDLRFARGTNYAGAAKTADLFADSDGLLLDWGSGKVYATAKTNAVKVPVMALVNRETAGAAEALAALVRYLGVGIVIGTNTAGRIFAVDEFELTTGQRLRIARAQVKLGDGQPLPEDGLCPDIAVAVRPEDERVFLVDPYGQIAPADGATQPGYLTNQTGGSSQTNRFQRRRLNEAELMREHMEGLRLGGRRPMIGPEEPEKPVVTDPVLARALDLLKGLAVLRQAQEQ